jgi:hypothetical protein
MCEVNECLQHFYLKREICQLIDQEYDMSMPNFANT